MKGEIYIRFGKENVFIQDEEIQSTVKWSVWKKAFETPSAFLLLYENEFIHIFPKSCFSCESDIDALRVFLIDEKGLHAEKKQ